MDQSATKSDTSSSVLINYKDEERQMSESLYRNLHVLTRFHEPSAEFLLYFNPVNNDRKFDCFVFVLLLYRQTEKKKHNVMLCFDP